MSAWHEQVDQPQQIVDANGIVWTQYDRLTEFERVWVRADGTSEMPLPGRAIENQYGPCKPYGSSIRLSTPGNQQANRPPKQK